MLEGFWERLAFLGEAAGIPISPSPAFTADGMSGPFYDHERKYKRIVEMLALLMLPAPCPVTASF